MWDKSILAHFGLVFYLNPNEFKSRIHLSKLFHT